MDFFNKYQPRIKKVRQYDDGTGVEYTYEVALKIPLQEGASYRMVVSFISYTQGLDVYEVLEQAAFRLRTYDKHPIDLAKPGVSGDKLFLLLEPLYRLKQEILNKASFDSRVYDDLKEVGE